MNASSISANFVGIPGGLLMALIAFSIVFIVIVGLMCVMMSIKVMAHSLESKKAAPAPQAAAPAAAPVAAPQAPAAQTAAADDDELVAVIGAVIAATCGSGARVLGYAPAPHRAASGSAWRVTGRLQNCEGFGD